MEIELDDTFEQIVVISSRKKLNVEAYAGLYSGRTKIQRLLFINENCHDESMQLDSLKLAYDELKNGQDMRLFKSVVGMINGRLGPDYGLDVNWIDQVNRESNQRRKELEDVFIVKRYDPCTENFRKLVTLYDELKKIFMLQSRMRKEELISRHKTLGDFHYARGSLDDAFENYKEAERRGNNPTERLDLCQKAILVSIDRCSPMINILTYVSRVKYMIEYMKLDDMIITKAKLKCATGLAHLMNSQYKMAAKKFVKTPEFGDKYSEVIAAHDVATYGGLCALASFDREELKTKVIENKIFGKFLELAPEMRELINDFYTSRFSSCLEHLEEIKPNLLLDIHIHAHVDELFEQIRKKALIQYTIPYSSVDMNMMATIFRATVAELEKELVTLIAEGHIQAKIDSVNKVMNAHRVNQRNSVFQQVLESGSQLERATTSMMQRFSILRSMHKTTPSGMCWRVSSNPSWEDTNGIPLPSRRLVLNVFFWIMTCVECCNDYMGILCYHFVSTCLKHCTKPDKLSNIVLNHTKVTYLRIKARKRCEHLLCGKVLTKSRVYPEKDVVVSLDEPLFILYMLTASYINKERSLNLKMKSGELSISCGLL
ncbi:COP9 signalosome complex subunit 1-like [Rutidosis leptorrhynchoides]|uniref:COP9 signalosome complex subunit 1-like n=1 Tax=Rutidosis leptorrhynchoides TaxID=125765 RepID=UPI003A99DC2F